MALNNLTKICEDDGQTAFHIAVSNNHLEIINSGILDESEINIKNKDGHTPLYLACLIGNLEMVTCLINAGANLNIQNEKGKTALHLATKINNEAIISKLINSGADLNIKNDKGDTALHGACIDDRKNIFMQLINAGADLNIQNKKGVTALHYAIDLGRKDMVECIISKARGNLPALKELLETETFKGMSALEIAKNIEYPKTPENDAILIFLREQIKNISLFEESKISEQNNSFTKRSREDFEKDEEDNRKLDARLAGELAQCIPFFQSMRTSSQNTPTSTQISPLFQLSDHENASPSSQDSLLFQLSEPSNNTEPLSRSPFLLATKSTNKDK